MCQCECIHLYLEVHFVYRGTYTHIYMTVGIDVCFCVCVYMHVDIDVCLRPFLGCSEEHNSLETDSSSASHCPGWHHRQLGYKRLVCQEPSRSL